MAEIINQYQDGEYTVTEYASGRVERRLPSAPNIVAAIRSISALAFIRRFTDDEWAALDVASIDDPAAGAAVRRAKAKLRRFLTKLLLRKLVHLDDADLADDLAKLVAANLLAANRPAEILVDGTEAEA